MYSKLRHCSEDFEEQQEPFNEENLKEFYPKLRQYCQFLSHNCWDSEDLVQESLIKAWKHYRHQSTISTPLLNKIARNEWIDTIRKRNKELIKEIPDSGYEETHHTDLRFDVIQQIMQKLTPKQATIFVLKEGFNFQTSEIAKSLKINETAVKATIYRAKHRLANNEEIERNTVIEKYWSEQDKEKIQKIFHDSFRTQDPSIIIRNLPTIHAISKNQSPSCIMQRPSRFKCTSRTVSIAA
ncbi:sigma-70 family RNA polymerase sigma factor [Bacillus sinesaloumensis]|uniref:sigma-70 family RNA polymerase sigma factor n=1 Tax=Litchfieldia sinesaloumensis TaxID=1926280 RepID=UPI0013562D14|nr:sigma-70 family RNA polymerase sigma factor [Bacillus sinesaloumensis]